MHPSELSPTGTLIRDELPVAEQMLDSLADALWHVDVALGLTTTEGVNERYRMLRPSLKQAFELINSIMNHLSD